MYVPPISQKNQSWTQHNDQPGMKFEKAPNIETRVVCSKFNTKPIVVWMMEIYMF